MPICKSLGCTHYNELEKKYLWSALPEFILTYKCDRNHPCVSSIFVSGHAAVVSFFIQCNAHSVR